MISVILGGRFSNHLFQYSVCRIVADKNNYKYHIPKYFLGNNFFKCDLGINEFNKKYEYLENVEQKFDSNIFNISDNTLLNGYFQTEKYFIGYEKEIKNWFKIDNIIIDDFENTCYIHFRGTDYTNTWQFLPKEYYEKAKKEILLENPNVKFKIITDDIKVAKMFFNDEIISNSDIIDFKILKSAKYLILSNSSFSWWAAWLNDDAKLIIAPERWYNYRFKNKNWFPFDIKSNKFQYI